MKKIGVWGWWKQKNLGDNWILDTMFKIFGKNIVPVNLNTINFSGFDFMICGGGGLFSDCIKAPWNKKNIGVPYGIFCIGTEFGVNSKELEHFISNAKFFYVRDKMTCNSFGLHDNCTNHYYAGDATFFDPIVIPEKSSEKIGVIWWKNFDKLYKWKPIWKYYIGTCAEYKDWETELSKKGEVISICFDTKLSDPIPYIKDCKLVVSQRYHGIIAAFQAGIPVIAIDIAPKIRAIMQEAGLKDYCLKLNEFYKFTLLYEKCMDERETIIEKMHTFTQKKKSLVNMAARNACRIIEEIL